MLPALIRRTGIDRQPTAVSDDAAIVRDIRGRTVVPDANASSAGRSGRDLNRRSIHKYTNHSIVHFGALRIWPIAAGRDDSPVGMKVIGRLDRALAPNFVDEELSNLQLAIVHDGRVAKHRESTATSLAIVVEGHRERIGGRNRLSFELQRGYSVADRFGQIDGVVDACHDVVVEPGNRRIDVDRASRASSENSARSAPNSRAIGRR
jgi:hypothetical protein